MAMLATRSDLINFYSVVTEELGYGDCDDTVFCGCGTTWRVPAEYPRLRALLNGLRLHRVTCSVK